MTQYYVTVDIDPTLSANHSIIAHARRTAEAWARHYPTVRIFAVAQDTTTGGQISVYRNGHEA